MGEYAPDTLVAAGREIARRLGGTFSGVVGDQAHGYGYHRSRNELRRRGLTGDYSILLSDDTRGPGDAASAIDVKLPPSQMVAVTKRLLARKESATATTYLREFFGTLDGRHVTGWDFRRQKSAIADDSHLWHLHLSVIRRYADDETAANAIVALTTEDDMDLSDKVRLSAWIRERYPELDETISVRTALGSGYGHARSAKDAAHEALAEARALRVEVAELRDLIERRLGNLGPVE